MAGIAVFDHRLMNMLHGEFILAILMTLEADLAFFRRGNQQAFEFAGMRTMAGDTITGPHRTMPVALGKDCRLMAVETEAADTCTIAAQLEPHGRLMGIVTVDTTVFHRRMNNAVVKFFTLGLVTDETEFLAGSLDGHWLVGAVRAVAGNTDTRAHRTVYMGGLAHIAVTVAGGAVGTRGNNTFEIELAAPLFMTVLTVEDRRLGVNKKTAETLGGLPAFFKIFFREIVNGNRLFERAGRHFDAVFTLLEADQGAEGLTVDSHQTFRGLGVHALDGNVFGVTADQAPG